MDISVIIPVKDEEKSLLILYKQFQDVFKKRKEDYELIFIDDGSEDNSYKVLQKLEKKDKKIRLIKFRANFGKSQALSAGFAKAKGDIVITMDADLQDDPKEIPKLLAKLKEGYDLVTGWRINRADTVLKKISSLLFNTGTSIITGIKLHDQNCGLKAMGSHTAKNLFLHGELHRFIPTLAAKNKYKVAEVKVKHRARKYGKSKYGSGIGRSWKGMLDLLTTVFISDYAAKPAHFFVKFGLAFFILGILLDSYVTYLKITTGSTQGKIPLLLAGILFILLGVQLLSTGLIAEMIAYYYSRRPSNRR
jgi:glycosyltransferase involved in cell wall biosynthesis